MRVHLPTGAPGRISSKAEPAADNGWALGGFPHPAPSAIARRHSITDQCSELLPRTMRVQISLPPPMWGCGPTDEGARLRTLRSEFNSLHPLHSLRSRGLRHDDASVLTKRSGLDSRREFQ